MASIRIWVERDYKMAGKPSGYRCCFLLYTVGLLKDPWIILWGKGLTYSIYVHTDVTVRSLYRGAYHLVVAGPFDTLDAAKAAYLMLLKDK